MLLTSAALVGAFLALGHGGGHLGRAFVLSPGQSIFGSGPQ